MPLTIEDPSDEATIKIVEQYDVHVDKLSVTAKKQGFVETPETREVSTYSSQLPKKDFLPSFQIQSHSEAIRLPPKVDTKDLKPNGFLLSTHQILAVKEAVKQAKTKGQSIVKLARARGRSEEELKELSDLERNLNLDYSVLVGKNGEVIALYKGKEFEIGRGAFGVLKSGQDLNTGEWLAIKKPIEPVIGSEREKYESESQLTTEAGIQKGEIRRSSGDSEKIYSIQVHLRGTNLKKTDIASLSFSDKLNFMYSLLDDLSKLQAKNIIHADIHSENIMWDPVNKTAKLIDFGLSRKVGEGEEGFFDENRGKINTRDKDLFATVFEISKLFDPAKDPPEVLDELWPWIEPIMNSEDSKPNASQLAEGVKDIMDRYESSLQQTLRPSR